MKKQFIFGFLILSLAISLFASVVKAEEAAQVETAFDRLKKRQEKELPLPAMESIGNFLAVKTGQVKDGEQIPLPVYEDGKKATRKEVHYVVSPAEIPTHFPYISFLPSALMMTSSAQGHF